MPATFPDARAVSAGAPGSVLLGYTPLIDRRRAAIGMRLQVASADGAAPPALDRLYEALCAAPPAGVPPVLLALPGERLAADVLRCRPDPNLWLEVPAAFACSAEGAELVAALMQAGFRLALRGRPPAPLAPRLLPGFKLSLIDYHDDRRLKQPASGPAPAGVTRAIPHAQSGVTRIDEMEHAFAHGAVSCIGWPWDDALQQAGRGAANPDLAAIAELIALVEQDADPADLERVLRRDASLAYRLLRYINSAAMGLSVQITSFRHAVMILGYQRLRRWLSLLLVNASREPNLRPVMFASFRRGVFLENLIGAHGDEALRDEVFILGVFSLLDKLFRQPFERLFESLRVPDNVRDTLVSGGGPYAPYLRIAEGIERGPDARLAQRLAEAVLSPQQCNQALLRTLAMPDLTKAAP